MTHTGSPSPSVMKPMENLRYRVFLVVVVDDRRFRGKGFQFRNQFANSVHDVLQYDGGA